MNRLQLVRLIGLLVILLVVLLNIPYTVLIQNFELMGQSELLATVIPVMPVLKTTAIGFVLWEVWLLMVGYRFCERQPNVLS